MRKLIPALLCVFGLAVACHGFGGDAPVTAERKGKPDKPEPRRLKEEWGFEPLHTITIDPDCVRSIVFSPDSKTLAAADGHGKIRFWDVATGKPRKTVLTHVHPKKMPSVTAIAFSPDGRLLTSTRDGENGGLRLWDLETEREIAKVDTAFYTSAPAFDAAGKTLVAIDTSHVIVFDVAKKALIWKLDNKDGTGSGLWVAISPDGKKVVHNGATSPRLHIWDCVKGEKERVITASGSMYAIHWTKDGKSIVAVGPSLASYSEVSYWHADKGTHYKNLDMAKDGRGGASASARSLVFSADEKYLAMGDLRHRLEIWNTATRKSVAFDHCWLPAISPDGKMFACVRFVGDVERIEILEFKKLQKLVD